MNIPQPMVAVACAFIWQDEIFMVKRKENLTAFPGYTAFPGGKVDTIDAEQILRDQDKYYHLLLNSDCPPLHYFALKREIQEELGQNLEHLSLMSIYKLGVATTPMFQMRRYQTHFYAIHLDQRPEFQIDDCEIQQGMWKTLAEWEAEYLLGQHILVPPIIQIMNSLRYKDPKKFPLVLDISLADTEKVPVLESVSGIHQYIVRSNTLPPAEHTNAFLMGDPGKKKVLIDPSPKDEMELQKLVHTIGESGVDEIFITHHHSDHHERAPVLARLMKIPLGMSKVCFEVLFKKYGPQYLQGLAVNFYSEGDILTFWKNKPVSIYEIPGHDRGQLGLAPSTLEWFIVGDLIQGIGTVVIARPEGNMQEYYASLKKVMALNPQIIFPSHGIALGGVYRLQTALARRMEREQQILQLYQQGKSIEEMLLLIYSDIETKLFPLARMNIEAHLEKLQEEKLI